MKKLLFLLLLAGLAFVNCSKSSDESSSGQEIKCNMYNGHQLYTGPEGGCYYKSSGGNKEYVDRANCSCN